MLLFPPHWTPAMPHLALPTLTAHLRVHGVEVIQRDLNIEVFDAILTHSYLKQAITYLRQNYEPHAERWPARPAVPSRERVQWALDHGPMLVDQVEDAVNVVRSDVFLDGPTGVQAFFHAPQSVWPIP